MELQETFNTIRTNYAEQLNHFRKALLSGMCSVIYPEYFSRLVQKPKQNGIQLFVPSLKKIQYILSSDSEFMNNISQNLINDIVSSPIIEKCINYPELVIFDKSKIDTEVLKVLFDINIIDSISAFIIKLLSDTFKIGQGNQSIAIEDDKIPFEFKSDDVYHFIVKQIIYHLIIESKSFLTDPNTKITFVEKNMGNRLNSDKYIVSVRARNFPCDIYFDNEIIDSSIYFQLSLMTNTTIVKDLDGMDPITGYDTGVRFLNSGPFNQLYLFENSNGIF